MIHGLGTQQASEKPLPNNTVKKQISFINKMKKRSIPLTMH